jgi:thiamine biosynthesis protein ThiI
MEEVIIVKYGEVMLKGQNRPFFVNTLIQNLRNVLKYAGGFKIEKGHSLIYLKPSEDASIDKAMRLIPMVFGVVVYHRALKIGKEFSEMKESIIPAFENRFNNSNTFKLETRRADKNFSYKSHEINTILGDYISQSFPHLSVDVHNPDMTVFINIRKEGVYMYSDKEKGPGGLPVGTGGKSTVLLSGGIDSPLAAWLMARRGVSLDLLHFYSYPYTSERSKNKVIELSRQLAKYAGELKLHVFPFTEIQETIVQNCPKDQLTIIMRRQMMKAAEKIASSNGSQALVTGESIGQVASQTMEGLTATNAAVDIPVFRPLIGMDKEEIVEYSRGIGTYNISIQPYTDCCTIFVPKHPQTKPKVENIEKSEEKVNFDELINNGIDNLETITVKPEYF